MASLPKNKGERAWRITLYIIGYGAVNGLDRSPKRKTAFCFGLNRVIGAYLLVCT